MAVQYVGKGGFGMKGPADERQGLDGKAVKRLLQYVKKQKGSVAVIFFCALAAGAMDVSGPYLLGLVIDRIGGADAVRFREITPILLLMTAFCIAGGILTYFVQFLSNRTANRVVCDMRQDAYKQLGRLPIRFYDTHAHGDVISRFSNDADAVGDGLMQGIVQIFTGGITVVGSLVFMLALSPAVTLVVVLISLLTFLVAYTVTRLSNRYFTMQQNLMGTLSGKAEELISGLKTVKAFSYEERAEAEFDSVNRALYTAGQKAQFASSLSNPSMRFVANIAYIAVGVIGGAVAGLTAGRISSFIVYSTLFSRPFNEISAVATQLLAALSAVKRLLYIIDYPAEPPDAGDASTLTSARGEVDFDHVNFSYSKDKSLIEDLNMTAKPGETVAIVGPTGAGKTTMINLLMRFYDVDEGAIHIDGQDITRVKRESLRRSFGMVLQDTWLFYGTIRENLAYASPKATAEEIEAAAKSAHAHSFIERLPEGYDTMLSGDGDELSGGQKQLLTIARAMLANPRMLILDEATSSVDTLTEQKIQRAFLKIMKGKTSFVIAHRLSTIKNADLILVMKNGSIVEQGSHKELLGRNGLYAELYNGQFLVK